MDIKEKTALLNEYFFFLYQNKHAAEKKTCSDSPLSALTYNDIRVFEAIEIRRRLNMRDLAGELDLPMSTLTGIVDKLVEKGFVKRDRCHQDRRDVEFQKLSSWGTDFERMKEMGRDVGNLIGATDYIDFRALGYKGDPILYGGRFKKLPLGSRPEKETP